jgi:predicted enzyme related to lactoylglutathione lyase
MSHEADGRWVWHEMNTTDMGVGSEYYRSLFGWGADEMDMGEFGKYLMLKVGEVPVVGMGAAQPGAPSHWLSYLHTSNLEGSVAKVPELGGTLLAPIFEIPRIGRAAVVQDPDGGVFALFQGTEGGGEERDWSAPPAMHSVCWVELMAKDPSKVLPFYTGLVDWSAVPMGPDMTVFKKGEAMVASVRQMPPEAAGAPSHWMVYMLVDDVAVSQKRSEALGGVTFKGETEIPGMGRFAVVQDPAGGVFALWKQLGTMA